MNDPYPTKAQLRTEAAADRLLAEQTAVTTTFHGILRHAIAAIAGLSFPLGCPAPGWDIEEITATLTEWLVPRDGQYLEDLALDAARGELEAA